MERDNRDQGDGERARGTDTSPRRTRLSAPERRETILRAAADVFARAGYRAAKVSDVAARVGVSEPVVFQNFGSKTALFAAVVERAAADVRASLDSQAAGAGSAAALLSHVLTGPPHGRPGGAAPGHDAPLGTGAPLGRDASRGRDTSRDAGPPHAGAAYGVLFSDAATLAADPELAGPARDAVRAVAAHLADLIRRGQADGGIRSDADPEAAAWLLLSVLSARRLRAAAMPCDLEPAVADLVLQALAPSAARR